jgi:uncharacterized membrane protein YedE/YeeE
MIFENFGEAQSFLLWATFAVALVMGAVVNKTNFCTMGAVSDWVNMGDTGRMRAWLLAIAVALLGVVVLESMGLVQADGAFPPYRAGQFLWAEHLLGGVLFGIGMTLASGCGNKCLIRIGGGNIKSVMVLLIIGVIAYFMVNPFPGSDQTLFTVLFYDWIRPLSVQMGASQDLGSLVASGEGVATARLVIGVVLALAVLAFVFKSAEFRGNTNNIIGGIVVGAAVIGGWYISSNVMVGTEDESFGLQNFVAEQWDMYAGENDVKPADSRPLSPQSFTFINPMGQTIGYGAAGFDAAMLTFGIMAVAGVILGSLIWSVISRGFRFEWFASFKDFLNHFIGAMLMGFGGVLAMGCTIGQGVTGISTLALGSFVTFAAIVFGSALTMKIAYYRMVYEDASFLQAFATSLVDMRLLPGSMRKLEAI